MTKKKERITRIGKPKFSSLLEAGQLSRIVHKIGHEIGNPLTSIISLATVLERSAMERHTLEFEKLVNYAQSISREAWRITAITEKLVYLLSDRSGLSDEAIEPGRIVKRIASKLRARPDFQSVSLTFEFEPIALFVEPDHLAWTIGSVLENAFLAQIAESDPPPITVLFEPGKELSVISITNVIRGPLLVDPDELFEPFISERAEERRLGLGLTVVASLMDRLKGKIEIVEEDQDGSIRLTTRLSFPSARVTSSPTPPNLKSVKHWEKRISQLVGPYSVAIVDDDASVALAMEKILSLTFSTNPGISVATYRPEEFLRSIEKRFDAVLCDLNLGEVSGRHLYESFCERNSDAAKHFAFITGDVARHEAALYLGSCGCPFLKKPFEPRELIEATVRMLEG